MSFETSCKDLMTKENLEKIFKYDEITGTLLNRKTNLAFCLSQFENVPKVRFYIDKKKFTKAAHTVIWVMCFGVHPKGVIFHRDFNSLNFKINNLIDIPRVKYYELLTARNNLLNNCKIKPHKKFKDVYTISHIFAKYDKRMRTERFYSEESAKRHLEFLKEKYRREIVNLGGIPPI